MRVTISCIAEDDKSNRFDLRENAEEKFCNTSVDLDFSADFKYDICPKTNEDDLNQNCQI